MPFACMLLSKIPILVQILYSKNHSRKWNFRIAFIRVVKSYA